VERAVLLVLVAKASEPEPERAHKAANLSQNMALKGRPSEFA
jgi:hypothetical protein